MNQKQRLREGRNKGDAGSLDKPFTKSAAEKAVKRFKSLTRGLIGVSKGRLQEEQERYFNEARDQEKPVK